MPRERLNSRQRELDRMELDARYRQEEARRRRSDYYEDQWSRPNNTMGPNEEVMEKRRRRKHVVISTGSRQTHSLLCENLILLAALVASIYGLYNLCIFLLNQ